MAKKPTFEMLLDNDLEKTEVTPEVTEQVTEPVAEPVDEFAGLPPQTVAEMKAGREALARRAAALAKE